MVNPRTTVVIPCYKVDTYLRDALQSVIAQGQTILEIIVIDDGSPSPLQQPDNWNGPRLKWIRTKNQGLGAARNVGIEHASGEFIAFLDADDHWEKNKISEQERLLDANPRAVACYTQCCKGDGYYEFGPYPPPNTKNVELSRILWYGQFYPPSSVLVRTNIAKKVNGFREGLVNGEDLDFWFRIMQHGEIIGVDLPLTWYRVHENQITSSTVRRVMGSKEARQQIIDRYSNLLLKSGLKTNQLWDAYRREILNVYFHRQFKAARTMIWDYLKDHPGDLKMWKYLLVTILPSSLVQRTRG